MNIYVSGRLYDSSVPLLMRLLEAHGHTITFDWTQHGTSAAPGGKRALAEAERKGVWDADILIVNNVTEGGVGTWLEAGLALSHGIPVILFGECRESLFWSLPEVERIKTITYLVERLEGKRAAPLQVIDNPNLDAARQYSRAGVPHESEYPVGNGWTG